MAAAWFTLAMQILILIAVSGSCLYAQRTTRLTRETGKLIQSFRSEVAWLQARMDVLEGRPSEVTKEHDLGR